eukprot:scaffold38203_cov32-Tisochrysis_lutea.AAC.1
MRAAVSLFVVLGGRGALPPSPNWPGGSSWRGRFGDREVSMSMHRPSRQGRRRRGREAARAPSAP